MGKRKRVNDMKIIEWLINVERHHHHHQQQQAKIR